MITLSFYKISTMFRETLNTKNNHKTRSSNIFELQKLSDWIWTLAEGKDILIVQNNGGVNQ